jgi:hypothetical protein
MPLAGRTAEQLVHAASTRTFRLLVLLWVFCAGVFLPCDAAFAADLSKAFFEADGCARALRKDPAAQKLRHNWERCIDRFQAVYRQDDPRPLGAGQPVSDRGALPGPGEVLPQPGRREEGRRVLRADPESNSRTAPIGSGPRPSSKK